MLLLFLQIEMKWINIIHRYCDHRDDEWNVPGQATDQIKLKKQLITCQLEKIDFSFYSSYNFETDNTYACSRNYYEYKSTNAMFFIFDEISITVKFI